MALVGLAIASGLGLAKSKLVDEPMANKQRQLAAETARYSPWTGLKANPVKEADPFGSALQFGGAGAAIGAGIDEDKTQQEIAKRVHNGFYSGLNVSGGGGNPWGAVSNANGTPFQSAWGNQFNYANALNGG